jgi:type IV pilus assembly protein PilM
MGSIKKQKLKPPAKKVLRSNCIGLDIGAHAVKIVALGGGGLQATQTKFIHSIELPEGCVDDGVVLNPQLVGKLIRETLMSSGIGANACVLAVSGARSIVRTVELPKMPEPLLRKSIKFEAGKYISSSIEESVVEFEVLDPQREDGQMSVLLVAAPQQEVDSRLAVAEEAGLDPIACDLEPFALHRALCEFDPERIREKIALLVDLGETHTDLVLVVEGEFVLTRSMSTAQRNFTHAVMSQLNKEPHLAVDLKRQLNLEQLADPTADSSTEQFRAARAVQPLLDEMLREVRRSIHYYFQSEAKEAMRQAAIDQIYLAGGGAGMGGIARVFSQVFSCPCELADPFASARVSGGDSVSQTAPAFAVALGLALKDHPTPVGLAKAA